MNNHRIIKVCSGIGDNIWLAQKLVNQSERFNFWLPDGKPQRGKQIFDVLPQIANRATYVPGLSYNLLAKQNIQNKLKNWRQITHPEFFLTANAHLEAGKRIEDFLPDLPTSFVIDYATDEEDKRTAKLVVPHSTVPVIGIYGSAYSTQRAWGFWDENGWFELIQLLRKKCPEAIFVIIGAHFDIDLAGNLMKLLDEEAVNYIDTIGQPLSVVIEILKRLNYFIGFPSGLSILNETLGKNGVMFYPFHLQPMMNAWANPERIASGEYKGCLFCSPKEIYNWIVNNYKLFDKL